MKTAFCLLLAIFVAAILTPTSVAGPFQQEPKQTKSESGKSGEIKQEEQWRTIKPTGAFATFEMPKKPRYVERPFTPVKGQEPIKVRLHISVVDEGRISYMFSYHDLPREPKSAKMIRSTLDGAMVGSIANVGGRMVDKPKELFYRGRSGRQFMYQFWQEIKQRVGDKMVTKEQEFIVYSVVYLAKRRQYQLSVVMRGDVYDQNRDNTSRFVNSFRVVEPESDLPPLPRQKR